MLYVLGFVCNFLPTRCLAIQVQTINCSAVTTVAETVGDSVAMCVVCCRQLLGLEYRLLPEPHGEYGHLAPDLTWNGMIRQLIDRVCTASFQHDRRLIASTVASLIY